MIERLPTPWGLVRLGCRARPSEHQIGVARLRADRGETRVPLLRQRRGRAGRLARGAGAALRRGRLRGRRPDRPAPRHPGRGSPGLVAGHGVRRLVQRPPRLPGSGVRPLRRARGRRRQRQRRRRRRADARVDGGGARSDGHDRARDRGDRRLRHPRDPHARPARPGAGGLHDTRAAGARRARRRGRRRRPRRSRARSRPAQAALAEDTPIARRNLEVLREYAARRPDRQAALGGASLLPLAGRDPR